MKTKESPLPGQVSTAAEVRVLRRSLLRRLLVSPIVCTALFGLPLPSSKTIVVRNGWVLSKAD